MGMLGSWNLCVSKGEIYTMDKQIGDWIEVNNNIYEITAITQTDYIVKKVLYNTETRPLKYDNEPTIISKRIVAEAENGTDIQ